MFGKSDCMIGEEIRMSDEQVKRLEKIYPEYFIREFGNVCS